LHDSTYMSRTGNSQRWSRLVATRGQGKGDSVALLMSVEFLCQDKGKTLELDSTDGCTTQ